MTVISSEFELARQALAPIVPTQQGGPVFDLNFLNGGPLDSRVAFTRASTATYFDVTGVRQSAGVNVGAIGFDPTTHAPAGLQIEEQRTNSFLNSEAPLAQTLASLAIGTYCVWLEGSGTVTSSAGSAVGTGFGAATAASPNVFNITTAGTVVMFVSGSPTRVVVENGAFPTSYIQTGGSAVTRGRDSALLTLPAAVAASMARAGTMVFEGMFPQATNPNTVFCADLSDGSTNNRITVRRVGGATALAVGISVGGATTLNGSLGNIVAGANFKLGVRWGAKGCAAAFNGSIGLTTGNSAAAMPALGSGAIGTQVLVQNSQMCGMARRWRLWPRALNDGEFSQVTT